MSKVSKWFKDNEAVIVITLIFLLIILVVVGILVGIGFSIDFLVKKTHENYVLNNYKVIPYNHSNKQIINEPNILISEYISEDEKKLLLKYREFKKTNPNKKLKIISNINNKSIVIFRN